MTTQFKCSKDKSKLEEWVNNLVEDYKLVIDHAEESTYQVYESENDTFTTYYGLEIFYRSENEMTDDTLILDYDESQDKFEILKRLIQQYEKHGLLIIAYDLDDTVRPFRSKSCDAVIKTIKNCQKYLNCIFIVYTANTDMKANIKFLEDNDLPYDAINDYPKNFPIEHFRIQLSNARYFKKPSPKLYYNILLDDKSCGLRDACKLLNYLCYRENKKKNKEDF